MFLFIFVAYRNVLLLFMKQLSCYYVFLYKLTELNYLYFRALKCKANIIFYNVKCVRLFNIENLFDAKNKYLIRVL